LLAVVTLPEIVEALPELDGRGERRQPAVLGHADHTTLLRHGDDERVALLGESERRGVTGAARTADVGRLTGEWQMHAEPGDPLPHDENRTVVAGRLRLEDAVEER